MEGSQAETGSHEETGRKQKLEAMTKLAAMTKLEGNRNWKEAGQKLEGSQA